MNKKSLFLLTATGCVLASNFVLNFELGPASVAFESKVKPSSVMMQPDVTEFNHSNILDWSQLKTFRQTGVDGELKVDEQGNLVVDRDLRHWFDFYLSAIGELDLDVIINKMKFEINLLPSPANVQADRLLKNYLGYKTELAEYEQREALSMTQVTSLEALSDRLEWQKRLRRHWFDQTSVQAFWQLDEALDDYAQQRLIINTSDLSSDIKQVELTQLEYELVEELPQGFKEFRQEITQVATLDKAEAIIKQGSADDSEAAVKIQTLRTELLGEQAVRRLQELDQKQASWQERILSYQLELDKINRIQGISLEDKNHRIHEYELTHFEERERLRLKAALQLLASD
jgi:lipase chaperone LimK